MDQKLKVFLVTRRADWCEDDAIAVLAVDKLHAERLLDVILLTLQKEK